MLNNLFPCLRSLRGLRVLCGQAVAVVVIATGLQAQPIPLQALVTPSTVISKDGRPVTFALHGFIEFKSLGEMFPYIESQTQRWNTPSGLDEAGRRDLARDLLRRELKAASSRWSTSARSKP